MYKQNNFKTFVLEKKNLYFCIYTVSLFLKQSHITQASSELVI